MVVGDAVVIRHVPSQVCHVPRQVRDARPIHHRQKGARYTIISGKDQEIDSASIFGLWALIKKLRPEMAHVGDRDLATVLTCNGYQRLYWGHSIPA